MQGAKVLSSSTVKRQFLSMQPEYSCARVVRSQRRVVSRRVVADVFNKVGVDSNLLTVTVRYKGGARTVADR